MERHIDDLLTICESDLKDARSDKVAVRRTRAALQTAKYLSRSHFPQTAQMPATGPVRAPDGSLGQRCICPNGAADRNCPMHKQG